VKKDLRKTNIVCTIGPASEKRLEELINTGMGMARINFSHGSYPEQEEKINDFLEIREKLAKPCAMLLDMQGPEVRTGMLITGKNEKIMLEDGQKFILMNEDIVGDKDKVSVSYKELYKDVKPGNRILIDDGAIELKVEEIVGKDVHCIVTHGAKLGSRKTMNFPDVSLRLPALKEKDIQDLKDGARVGFDYVAGSFVRNVEDVRAIRKVLDDNGGKDVKIICKIENQEGIDNIQEIIDESDGIMVARGDMAVEVPFEKVPVVQKDFIKRCNEAGKPVITATQMLESMTENPLPTRAEVSDVANAVFDRSSCVMLSGECAMGKYPIECVNAMVRISKSVESSINYWKRFDKKDFKCEEKDLEFNVSYTTCVTAKNVNADAIVAYTHTGNTARRLSGMGAECPIFAITDNKKTYNQLAIVWNVFPVLVEKANTIDATIKTGIEKLKEEKIIESGDVLVIAGGNKLLETATESKMVSGVIRI
jgi:pyruvate kinase